MTAREILEKAREKIARPENWCRGALARDAKRRSVRPETPEACRWCVFGAVQAATNVNANPAALDAFRLLNDAARPSQGMDNFNDNYRHSHADILALFDRAIALSEKAP